MVDLKLPEIKYPFPENINPHASEVQQRTREWGERLNIFQIDSFIYENFEKK